MNNKGFTLVELLAMLVVLGILMAVSIPNITGILANNKLNVMRADATKMVDTAKIKFSSIKESKRPTSGKCIVYALNALNDSGDINTGPNGGQYLQYDSFVVIVREAHKYQYYVRLLEKKDSKIIGMNLVKREKLSEDTTDYIKSIRESELMELEGNKGADIEILKGSSAIRDTCHCNSVIDYYPGRQLN